MVSFPITNTLCSSWKKCTGDLYMLPSPAPHLLVSYISSLSVTSCSFSPGRPARDVVLPFGMALLTRVVFPVGRFPYYSRHVTLAAILVSRALWPRPVRVTLASHMPSRRRGDGTRHHIPCGQHTTQEPKEIDPGGADGQPGRGLNLQVTRPSQPQEDQVEQLRLRREARK